VNPTAPIAWLAAIILAYLFGSIPFGLVLTRLFADVDIRQAGSGNIGATNVRRLAGTPLGVLTLVGDIGKGAVPVLLAQSLAAPDFLPRALCLSLVALAAFCGHLFPVYMKMKNGGKGVATAAGSLAAISPPAVLVALGVFLLVAFGSNRVSAGSLAAAAALPPAIWWTTHSSAFAACALVMAVGIFIRHRANIRRLLDGTEPGIRSKRSAR
jgi:glycerol-3-phosphate acyltransferase PlsY